MQIKVCYTKMSQSCLWIWPSEFENQTGNQILTLVCSLLVLVISLFPDGRELLEQSSVLLLHSLELGRAQLSFLHCLSFFLHQSALGSPNALCRALTLYALLKKIAQYHRSLLYINSDIKMFANFSCDIHTISLAMHHSFWDGIFYCRFIDKKMRLIEVKGVAHGLSFHYTVESGNLGLMYRFQQVSDGKHMLHFWRKFNERIIHKEQGEV